ncbi:hypothetical protein Tsp_08563 [Trichinella spiralis]|uniref:hypothetical protein n=1 Tax=Trichinella spiralis TaxID=6334 RepID=UPI0001EFBD41|nr:hypothetical protein Tsp_08563 [Trichinella spiralis]
MPTIPGRPILPRGPCGPGGPWGPTSPRRPFGASCPRGPLSPAGPIGPGFPLLPLRGTNILAFSPGIPFGPTAPVGPFIPGFPGGPGGPGCPSTPGAPGRPGEPARPCAPATIDIPSTPGGPGGPAPQVGHLMHPTKFVRSVAGRAGRLCRRIQECQAVQEVRDVLLGTSSLLNNCTCTANPVVQLCPNCRQANDRIQLANFDPTSLVDLSSFSVGCVEILAQYSAQCSRLVLQRYPESPSTVVLMVIQILSDSRCLKIQASLELQKKRTNAGVWFGRSRVCGWEEASVAGLSFVSGFVNRDHLFPKQI